MTATTTPYMNEMVRRYNELTRMKLQHGLLDDRVNPLHDRPAKSRAGRRPLNGPRR